jgi:hypothetical protein
MKKEKESENEMPAFVDFSGGERGKFFGKIKYANRSATQRDAAKCFAICLLTDDPELLIPLKIYQVALVDEGYLKVKDENGDVVSYPEEYFALVSFPQDIARRLKEAQQAA